MLASNAQEARPDEPTTLLPDISPQDIEIRGDFRARFAGISRQPILGFNPTPRVFRIDPNRMPFIETPEEVVASIPFSELEAELGPERILLQHPPASRMFGYAGFGSYTSPEARIYGSAPLGSNTALSGRIHFRSSEGHLEQINDGFFGDGAYRYLDTDISLRHRLSLNNQLLVQLRGRYDVTNNQHTQFYMSELQTDLYSFGANIAWISTRSAFDQLMVYGRAGYTAATKDLSMTSMPIIGPGPPPFLMGTLDDNSELRFGAGGSYSMSGRSIGNILRIETHHDTGLYEYRNEDELWWISEVAAYWQTRISAFTEAEIGARAFAGHDVQNEFMVMAYPFARIAFTSTDGLKLHAEVSGEFRNSGLEEPFVTYRNLIDGGLLINEQVIYGKAGAEIEMGDRLTLHGAFKASYIRNPRMFTAVNSAFVHPDELLLLQPSFGFSFDVDPSLLRVYANGQVNIANLNDDFFDDYLYLENYRITAGLRSSPTSDLVFTAWADFVGPAKTESNDMLPPQLWTDDLDPFLLLNAKAEYRFSGQFGVYVEARNILNQEYARWAYSLERPFQIFGGLTFKL